MFVLQNMGRQELSMDGLRMSGYKGERTTAKFDLTLIAEEQLLGNHRDINFYFEYSVDLFMPRTIQQIAENWLRCLKSICENEEIELNGLEITTDYIYETTMFTNLDFDVDL
ncbi:condensation domain-containing protein, partial [Alicyclobacillus fodiniaquatilis]